MVALQALNNLCAARMLQWQQQQGWAGGGQGKPLTPSGLQVVQYQA